LLVDLKIAELIDVLAASNEFVEDLNVVPAEADAIKQVGCQ
jgi:hypothetical protein